VKYASFTSCSTSSHENSASSSRFKFRFVEATSGEVKDEVKKGRHTLSSRAFRVFGTASAAASPVSFASSLDEQTTKRSNCNNNRRALVHDGSFMTDDDSEVIRSERGVLLLLLLRVGCFSCFFGCSSCALVYLLPTGCQRERLRRWRSRRCEGALSFVGSWRGLKSLLVLLLGCCCTGTTDRVDRSRSSSSRTTLPLLCCCCC